MNYSGIYPAAINNPRENLNTNLVNSKKAPEYFIDDEFFANLGHKGEFHMSFPDSQNERDRVFKGTIVEATADHLVIYNDEDKTWTLVPLLYLNYAVTNEEPV